MAGNRDPFFDDGEFTIPERREDPISVTPLPRKSSVHVEDPTTSPPVITRPKDPFFDDSEVSAPKGREDPISVTPLPRKNPVHVEDPTATPRLPTSPPVYREDPIAVPPPIGFKTSPGETYPEDPISVAPQVRLAAAPEPIYREDWSSSSRQSSYSESEETPVVTKIVSPALQKTAETQTDQISVQNKSVRDEYVQTETTVGHTSSAVSIYSPPKRSSTTPFLKTLLDQKIFSALPIISFCQPYSMTSHVHDIILAMPRHLMIITNNNSVSVYPWQQPNGSSSTILECHWCSFLYKLLVTTLEDNRLFVYDFVSIIDSIKLRGHPLSIKHQNSRAKQSNASDVLPSPTSRQQATPVISSQTRFTKSNSLGIYYCYLSERSYSCMLTRIDHNTRAHVKAIDCTGGSLDNRARICAVAVSDDRVAVVLSNLMMTLYDAETLVGLKQINLKHWHHFNLRSVGTLMYMWKTWVLLDPVENQIVGIGKRKRQFVKNLPEQPINACSMENGALALWLGYPGAILYYHLKD